MYRDKTNMGNRLAPQKSKYNEEEERKKAMMRKLSGGPGKTSSGMY
jgi:hypothetical protein